MKKNFILFLLIIFSINFNYSQENTQIKTAVINFTPIGVDKSTSDAITENFINSLIDSKAFEIIDKNQIKNLMTNLGINDSDGYNEELKNLLSADYKIKLIILGNVTKIGDIITVNIKGIKTETGNISFAKNIMTNNINDIAFLIPLLVDIVYEIEVKNKSIDIDTIQSKKDESEKTTDKEIKEDKKEEIKTDTNENDKVIIIINDDKNTIITTDENKTTIKTEEKKDNEVKTDDNNKEIKNEDKSKDTAKEDKEKELKEAEIELEKQEKEIKEQLEKDKKTEEKNIEIQAENKILLKEIKADDSWSSKVIELEGELKKTKFIKIIIVVENNCVEFARAKFYFDDPYNDIKINDNFFLGKNDIWSKTIETLTKKGAGRKLNKINLVVKNRECYNDSKAVIKIYAVK